MKSNEELFSAAQIWGGRMELRAQLNPLGQHPQLPWHSGEPQDMEWDWDFGKEPRDGSLNIKKHKTYEVWVEIVAGFANCQHLSPTPRALLLQPPRKAGSSPQLGCLDSSALGWIRLRNNLLDGRTNSRACLVRFGCRQGCPKLAWNLARCQKWNKKSAGSAALGNVQAPAWSHCFSYKLFIFLAADGIFRSMQWRTSGLKSEVFESLLKGNGEVRARQGGPTNTWASSKQRGKKENWCSEFWNQPPEVALHPTLAMGFSGPFHYFSQPGSEAAFCSENLLCQSHFLHDF